MYVRIHTLCELRWLTVCFFFFFGVPTTQLSASAQLGQPGALYSDHPRLNWHRLLSGLDKPPELTKLSDRPGLHQSEKPEVKFHETSTGHIADTVWFSP